MKTSVKIRQRKFRQIFHVLSISMLISLVWPAAVGVCGGPEFLPIDQVPEDVIRTLLDKKNWSDCYHKHAHAKSEMDAFDRRHGDRSQFFPGYMQNQNGLWLPQQPLLDLGRRMATDSDTIVKRERHKYHFYRLLGWVIGADEGEEANVLRLESTSGQVHGHPRAQEKLERDIKRALRKTKPMGPKLYSFPAMLFDDELWVGVIHGISEAAPKLSSGLRQKGSEYGGYVKSSVCKYGPGSFVGGFVGEVANQNGYGDVATAANIGIAGAGAYATSGLQGVGTMGLGMGVNIAGSYAMSAAGANDMQAEAVGRLAGVAAAGARAGPAGAVAYGVTVAAGDIGSIAGSGATYVANGGTWSGFASETIGNYGYYFGQYFGW
jgi:hypothetical protein